MSVVAKKFYMQARNGPETSWRTRPDLQLYPKAMTIIYLQKTNHDWTKTLQTTSTKTKSKSNVCCGFATTVHFVVAMENNKSMVPCVLQITTKN